MNTMHHINCERLILFTRPNTMIIILGIWVTEDKEANFLFFSYETGGLTSSYLYFIFYFFLSKVKNTFVNFELYIGLSMPDTS